MTPKPPPQRDTKLQQSRLTQFQPSRLNSMNPAEDRKYQPTGQIDGGIETTRPKTPLAKTPKRHHALVCYRVDYDSVAHKNRVNACRNPSQKSQQSDFTTTDGMKSTCATDHLGSAD